MSETPEPTKVNLYPLLLLAGAFVAGIWIESIHALDLRVLLATTSLLAFSAFQFREKWAGTLLIIAAFIFLGALCSISQTSSVNSDRIRSLIDNGSIPSGAPFTVEGTLISEPEPTSDGFISTLDVQVVTFRGVSIKASGRVRMYELLSDPVSSAEFDELDLKYGSHLSVACELSREEQFLNPGVTSRIELLDRQSIDAVTTVKSPLLIESLGEDSVFLPLAWVYDVRQYLLSRFRDSFSGPTAAVLSASMLGDKYFLDKPTADVFREGGTFHVLVISGLHITFIGGLLLMIIGAITKNRLFRFLFVTSVLWAYALAVGGEAPVVRACLMFTILLFSTVINRQGSLLNSLGACVIILLVWRPTDLFNPSLQLTLLSVLAIVGTAFPLIEKLRAIGSWMPSAAAPFPPNVPRSLVRFCEMLYWDHTAWTIETDRQIWTAKIIKHPLLANLVHRGTQTIIARSFEGLLVSLIVQAWLLPLLILYFHRFTPVSVLMNLWVGIVIALESFSALAAVAISAFSQFLSAPLFSLTEFLNYLLSSAPSFIVRSNWSSWRLPNYSGQLGLIYAIYFLPLVTATILIWKWDIFRVSSSTAAIKAFGKTIAARTIAIVTAAIFIVLSVVVILHPFSAPRADGRLHIDFLDVGQGDSALVTFPDGATMLVDGGGRMEFRKTDDEDSSDEFVSDAPGIGEAVVSPVLWNKGYSHIDHIVATHADADHIQGLRDVVSNFEVGEALFGREPENDPEFAALESTLKQHRVPLKLIARGQSMNFGGAIVEVLYPLVDPSTSAPSDNNHSVVLRIVFGNRAFLLTGDIESEAESALVTGGGTLKADVIKVPHHGSRTSSTPELINAVDAEYAVISVGKHSRFGHPHKEIVERLLASGARVLTTGQQGMISISTDGKDLNIRSFLDDRK